MFNALNERNVVFSNPKVDDPLEEGFTSMLKVAAAAELELKVAAAAELEREDPQVQVCKGLVIPV